MEILSLPEFERRVAEREKTYKIIDGDYRCKKCNSDIIATIVTFSVHDGSFPMSGSGRTIKHNYPYCPKCEVKPEIQGSPIKV